MNLKQLLATAVLAMSASLAEATVFTVDADPVTAGAQPMQAGSHYDQGVSVSAGLFEDTYNFTLASDLLTVWTTTNLFVQVPAIVIPGGGTIPGFINSNIDNLQVDLYRDQAVDTLLSDNLLVGTLALTAGNYYLKVSGNANGVMGGTYVLTLDTFDQSVVPEPQTLALTLLGLGLLAFSLRRS